MKKIVFITLILICGRVALGQQTSLKPFEEIQVPITPWHHVPALIHLPPNMKEGKKYPIIIAFHGKSIAGDDVTKIFHQGVTKQMHAGKNIDAVNKVDGKKYEFIVFAPLATSWSLGPEHLNVALDDLLKRYPIDPARVYITGYSAGGWSVGMAITDPVTAPRIAAAVCMSPASIYDKNLKSFSITAKNNIHTWYFAGTEEIAFLSNCKAYVDSTNKYKPGLTKITIGDHKHCCWETYYTPSYKEDGLNIYEWLLQYKK
ncbi:hypothetical protein DVR12_23290 [Chitinophaga silvatica]|uniref:Prolyl oligopeptidase family protein n=1 Tax=Chitinophaga silvatica TaxID=2282649 RepID=A0A3E1Y517_9BACT|nr:prolyl oligopeptidase family serine peptidase [Chitinophaga silvatica]RFS19557.1 hypothetical protein DVR12_23290 [Chitinophaga silvatica]